MRVLIIEDDPTIARASTMMLERIISDADLMTIESGDEAAALLDDPDYRPDLIVTDQNMPGLNGHELLLALKEKADCPILVYAAFENRADMFLQAVVEGYGLDASRIAALDKPARLDDLKAAITRLLPRPRAEATSDAALAFKRALEAGDGERAVNLLFGLDPE